MEHARPIRLACVLALLAGLLAGCGKYAKRNVRGAPLVLPAGDLLITNWSPGDESDFYVSYTSRSGNHRRVQWEKRLAQFDYWYAPQATFDEATIYYVAGARLLALARADGAIAWEAPLSDLSRSDCLHCIERVGDTVVVLTTDYVLQGVDARTGEPLWDVRLNDSATAWRGFEVINNQVLVMDYIGPGVYDWAFHVYDPADGSLLRRVVPTCPPGSEEYMSFDGKDEAFVQQRAAGNARAVFLYECWGDDYAQSVDLASGEVVWQVALPDNVSGYSVDSAVLGGDGLYLGIRNGLWRLALGDGRTVNLAPALDPDYRFDLLAEEYEVILAQARRTRGSTRYELWGLSPGGEILWRHEMQVDMVIGGSTSSADWAYFFIPNGRVVVVQVLNQDPDRILVETLNLQTGEVVSQDEVELEHAYLNGVSASDDTAYLDVRGTLYAVDLGTGAIAAEWP